MEDIQEISDVRFQGIKINYLYVCKRKLWLFSKNITFENTSDKVLLGKVLHEYSYPKENAKEVLIDNLIMIDILSDGSIREVKYSSKMKEADIMQVMYYLYYLKQKGIQKQGIINYPKEKRKEVLELTPEYEEKVKQALKEIEEITTKPIPPPVQKQKICKSCAYYEFCWG
ncbi:CRISPR-associated protein Cas4 [Thermoanaerobacter mathranii subsp. mathranii str. A3]|jgi:CRISPR-associated exonuclease Cas4|uniref:CRISPR-associated exonuclease Cas4 n=1 Tax=Thermoanaerobacter mathranii subsp. mathranii (strain DSM 11426 / CCUG 53645 / CIP 108742 / A3) TaxID=583358 RepID=A0ABN3Z1Z9_THEM3|nr:MULTISPECIES: CRISPR-associated protein Cas4 [Thermoanaerobacter]ADH59810.1 CRISPR-associated protein Cas4 [Thermoanaerobacter mathranii subsp. mathranii str. A3]MBT1279393.1 CRISPR-associated protein Cas4 [Thermoanaerobacter sp. CM-CNRG TB177]HAA80149.1 CRISPR-associated protein Cas4 [Thermoanaerobacter sp.]